jgi:AhpC/TSA family
MAKLWPSSRAGKILLAATITLAIAYLVCGVLIWRAMHKPPEEFAQIMSKLPGPVPFLLFPFESMWLRARAGNLKVGDPAPDFSLLKTDRSERVQLSTLNKGKPAVLVFGSYT